MDRLFDLASGKISQDTPQGNERNTMTVTVERIDPMSEVGRTLFEGSSAEQIARYGRDGGRKLESLAEPGVVFVAALLNGKPAGCGAVVPLESDTGELSRIFVVADARRNGVGRAILAALEAEARGRYERLVLETGTEQEESMHLYAACGYRPIPCWGKSADNPRSRCYEKVLT
jgi:GNAT superfamily N-acetyltransferase